MQIKVFCKLPSNKVQVVQLNQCDTPSQVRHKIEMHTRQSMEGTTVVYGVERMDEVKCLSDYDVVDSATIQIRGANKRGSIFGHGTKPGAKKWGDVAITDMHRSGIATGTLHVDYGSKFAPPCVTTGDGQLKQAKRRSIFEVGRATAAKINKARTGLLDTVSEEERDEEPDSGDEEEKDRYMKSKVDKIAMMRHAQLASKEKTVFRKGRVTNASYQREKAYLEEHSDLETSDFDYKYMLCLMQCCPCLRPETEEEIEQKHAGKEPSTARPILRTKRGEVLRQQDPMCAVYWHACTHADTA